MKFDTFLFSTYLVLWLCCSSIEITAVKSHNFSDNNSDPREPPNVDLNYFADERDVKVLTEGAKMAVEFANTRAFREKGVGIMGPDTLICGEFLTSNKVPDGYTQEYFECCTRDAIQ